MANEAFKLWWKTIILGLRCNVQHSHEAFCTGYAAGQAAERERILDMISAIGDNQMHRDTKRCLIDAIKESPKP